VAIKFLSSIDLTKQELQNARVQNLALAPSSPVTGQIYFNTADNKLKYYNGTAWISLEAATFSGLIGTAPIVVTDNGNGTSTISINAASGSAAGSMSAAHYTLVDNSTATNTASTLVKRDASGNFSAGTITAALTGTASNASQLENQSGSHYLSRANHTGTQSASTISDFDTQVRTNRLDQLAAPTSNVSLNSQRLTSLADPQNPQDAATKSYVDAVRTGLDVKESVRVATTANVNLSNALENGDEIDGITLVTGDRVLVKNQTTASQNGIYVVQATGAAVRATDFDSTAEVSAGAFTFVEEGTTNADSGWVVTTDGTITVGTDAIAFAQFSGAGQVTAGSALTKTGNTLDVAVDNVTIEVTSDALNVKNGGIGTNQLATDAVTAAKLADDAVDLSTATVTGILPVTHGGTGGSDAAGAKSSLGFTTKYSVNVGNNSNTTFTVTHNLGTRDVTVQLFENSSPYAQVYTDVEATTTNAVTLAFGAAPSTNQYRCVVTG
jgi:hypothetical protein